MLKLNSAALTTTPLSQPASFERKMSTETDSPTQATVGVAPVPANMMAYQYPMMYTNQMVHVNPVQPQPGYPQPMQTMTPTMTTLSPQNSAPPQLAQVPSDLSLQYAYSSDAVYHMSQNGAQVVPQPAQPASYPPRALISVKPADQMNEYETANWVKLVGEVQGWPESSKYAQAFFDHGMTGFMLAQLTMDDLEKYLGVEKHGHRLTLMSSIRSIHPFQIPFERSSGSVFSSAASSEMDAGSDSDEAESPLRLPAVQNSGRRQSVILPVSQRNLLVHETSSMSTLQMRRPQLIDDSSCSSTNSAMTYASSAATDTSAASSLNGEPRRAHLMLTLEGAPEVKQAMIEIRQHFQTKGFDVHPRVSEKAANKFIVRFNNEAEANRALSIQEEIGYDLSTYTEYTRKKGPRPTPSNPQQYMVLHHARMRSGKSMKSQVLGFVNKGEIYWVNQIKGKRARLIERGTSQGDRNLGWVSLRNNAGYQLMAPFHE